MEQIISQGRNPLCSSLPGKSIKLSFSTSPKTLSPRSSSAPVHREAEFSASEIKVASNFQIHRVLSRILKKKNVQIIVLTFLLFFSALFFIFPPFVLPFFHFPSFLGRFSYTFISLASPVRNGDLPIISGNIGCHSHQQLQPPLDSELVSPKGTQDMKTQIAGELRSALVTQSCLTLCNPMDCSLPGSSVHGISQGRILKWVAISLDVSFLL